MAMQGVDPYEEGELAAQRGDSAKANPYAPGVIEYERWRTGFDGVVAADGDSGPPPG